MEKFKIYETKDYSVFKFLEYNRKVDPKKLKKITASIKKYGLMVPIIVSSDGYVIDGQHRLSAMIKLQLPVIYIVTSKFSSEKVLEINNTQNKWTLIDYIVSQSKRGNADIKSLLEKTKELPHISVSVVAKIYAEKENGNSARIKKGTYSFDREKGDLFIDVLETVKNCFSEKTHQVYQSKFVDALRDVMNKNPHFEIKRLIEGSQNKPLIIYNNRKDIADRMVSVYNTVCRGDNRIYI